MPPDAAAPAPAAPAPPAAPSAPPVAEAWHTGTPPEVLTYWNNKGYDLSNPKDFALQLTDQYRNAERHIGIPADQLLRLPQPTTSEADRRAFYGKLGVPAAANDYDFTAVPKPEGVDIDATYLDGIRAAFHKNNVSKDAASGIMADIYKIEAQQRSSREAGEIARLELARAQLEREWGSNLTMNRAYAEIGQQKLGITNEMLEGLRYVWGDYKALDVLRMIGASAVTEDELHTGSNGSGTPTTASSAQAEIDRLKTDQSFMSRWLAGEKDAKDYMAYLHQIQTGVNPAFERP
jgi:hypothetical protein